ncbi:MAG TPA: MFS transporter, partial [Trebonia sp.]
MTAITQDLRRAQPQEELRKRRHNAAFWIVGYAFAVTMAFSAVPTPLYVLYQARDGFSTFMITVIFAAYAVGVVGSLFLAGHLSDWVGRRRMITAAIATNMLAGVLFLTWPATAGLIVARVVTGISIGMLTATATAYLSELHAAARPGTGHTRSEITSTAANLGGIGLGPLLTGLLAQYAGHALVIPFLVSEALMLTGAIALALAPETTARPQRRPAYRPQRVSVPAAHRSAFLSAAILGGALFALFGIFTSVAPSVLAGLLHNSSHAVAGVVSFAVFGASAGAQILFTRASRRFQVGAGAAAVVAGLAMVTAAVWLPSFWLLLAGGIVAGAGAGAAFRGAIATVISIMELILPKLAQAMDDKGEQLIRRRAVPRLHGHALHDCAEKARQRAGIGIGPHITLRNAALDPGGEDIQRLQAHGRDMVGDRLVFFGAIQH